MRMHIRAIPNSKRNKVVEEPGRLRIYLQAPAHDGKANDALFEALAEHFNVKRGRIRLLKGARSRDKIIEIGE